MPAARGRGFGTDALRVACIYGFRVRGLHRLGLETVATNKAMRKAAQSACFVREGRQRQAAWVLGERVNDILYGLLHSECRQQQTTIH